MSNRLLEYDPETNKWSELGPMRYSKYRCSAVALNGEIYVLGENFKNSVNVKNMYSFYLNLSKDIFTVSLKTICKV